MSTAPDPADPGRIRILLTGASGQLGREVQAAADSRFELLPLDRGGLDITDAASVGAAVGSFRPHWIVNAAAYTAVDRAEGDAEGAFAINRDGPANLALAAKSTGARMVQVSTDYVFGGELARPYRPDDVTGPVNVYGRSKLAGEVAVRQALGDDVLVLRTSWVYAGHGRNFLLTMLRLMRERSELRVVEDQVGTPTSAASLARAVLAAVGQGIVGTHHWTDAGVASWYDFALAIQEEGARAGLDTARCHVLPIPTDEYPTPARRPASSLLDKTSLRSASGITGRHWREELCEVLRALAGQGAAAG
jgi:dTDP-4-dehydrorhamnose reductase